MELFVSLATLAFAASAAVAQTFMVNTPSNVVVCEPIRITWNGGTAPYFPNLLPGSQPNGQPVLEFPPTSDQTLTWVANMTVGTSLGITIRDSTGTLAQSAPFTIMNGPDLSCLSGSAPSGAPTTSPSSSDSSATPSPSSSGAPATSTPTTTGSSTSTTTDTSSSSNNPSSTTAAASSTSSNTAPTQTVHFGAAALFGAAAVALLA